MEHPTLSILRNLPDGYRFDPTDEQILLKYLKPKLLGDPISGNDVIELNICDRNPRDLFCQFKGLRDLYFFCRCEYYDNSKLRKRKITDGGTWKSTGDPKLIAVEDENNRIIGKRRTLVYKNPDDDSKFVTIEYSYTAQLDRPTKCEMEKFY